MDARRILVVANRTAVGAHLRDAVLDLLKEGPCELTLLVPATPPPHGLTWTEGESISFAEERMREGVTSLQGTGAGVEGKVGDADPMDAITDELDGQVYDLILLSTLGPGISKWLKLDLPSRVAARFDIPLRHVMADEEAFGDEPSDEA